MKTVGVDQIPCDTIYNHLFVPGFSKENKTARLLDALIKYFSYYFPPLAASHSSPAGGAKTHTFVCQTPLNLRGRRLVSPRSLLFCRDGLKNLVSVNREIQFLNQVSKYL